MSERNDSPGAPAETQPSGGFGGERRDSEEVELSPQAEASERSLSRRVSRETSKPEQSAPPQRNKPSSFYVYLIILFGAAFLMLLLAYFVQQRNNETVLSDLRNSMNLSREELMEKTRQLEEENLALQKELDWQKAQTDSLQQRFDSLNKLHTQLQINSRDQLVSWADFWAMTESFRAEDYEACAGFYKNIFSTPSYYTYKTPESAQSRYDEIYQFLSEHGYLEEDAPAG